MDYLFIYMTAATRDEAYKISEDLLSRQLIACANILPSMESVYIWEGRVQKSAEVSVIFKTRAELFTPIKERVLDLHSYSCPCLVALPLVDGHPDFLQWISQSTLPAPLGNS